MISSTFWSCSIASLTLLRDRLTLACAWCALASDRQLCPSSSGAHSTSRRKSVIARAAALSRSIALSRICSRSSWIAGTSRSLPSSRRTSSTCASTRLRFCSLAARAAATASFCLCSASCCFSSATVLALPSFTAAIAEPAATDHQKQNDRGAQVGDPSIAQAPPPKPLGVGNRPREDGLARQEPA